MSIQIDDNKKWSGRVCISKKELLEYRHGSKDLIIDKVRLLALDISRVAATEQFGNGLEKAALRAK